MLRVLLLLAALISPMLCSSDLFAGYSASDFHIFSSRTQAEEWFQKVEKQIFAPKSGAAPRRIIPQNDPRYQVLGEALNRVYESFKRLRPEVVAELPLPEILLLDESGFNAQALRDPLNGELPYLLLVSSGVLATLTSPDSIAWLLAHELSHLWLRHLKRGTEEAIVRYFYWDEKSQRLDSEIPSDPSLKSLVLEWKELSYAAGPFMNPEFLNLPTAFSGSEIYFRLLSFVLNQQSKEGKPECQEAQKAKEDWVQTSFSTISLSDYQLHLNKLGLEKVQRASEHLLSSLKSCFGNFKIDLAAKLAEQFGLTKVQIEQEMAAPNKKHLQRAAPLFSNSTNFIDALTSAVAQTHQRMSEIERQADFARVHYYTIEDEADDLATEIISSRGANLGASDLVLLNLLPSEEERGQCSSLLNRGEVPLAGALHVAHHPPCYRIFRIRQLTIRRANGKNSKSL